MKYEDLKDSFEFKTMEGTSDLTYTADKVSKHVWSISSGDTATSANWDCEDMLEHFNSGTWVVQDEEETEEAEEIPVVQEQVEQTEQTQEVMTLRDELIIAVLPTVCKAFFSKNYAPAGWTKYIADDTIAIVDAVLKARKESE